MREMVAGVNGVNAARSLRSYSGPTLPEAYPAKVEARREIGAQRSCKERTFSTKKESFLQRPCAPTAICPASVCHIQPGSHRSRWRRCCLPCEEILEAQEAATAAATFGISGNQKKSFEQMWPEKCVCGGQRTHAYKYLITGVSPVC